MATLSRSESRRLYSWWWDSHISPKSSKWLQENLKDMDTKIKAMIKFIEEDADSFARRAEMYYKKRPELMKLVEEFYRAYRALAERYDHAMVELRHAHKTMAEALPNQAHYMLTDDSGLDAELQTKGVPSASFNPNDLQKEECGLSSIHNMSKKNEMNLEESDVSEHAGRAESEFQTLRKALAKIQSDKDAVFLQYHKSLERLSKMESDLIEAQIDAAGLDERASKAGIEIKILNEALAELKADRDAGLVHYNQCLESIASLETMLYLAQLDAKGLDERAAKAESEAKNLKQELTRLEAEKDTGLLQYKQCLENISVLEAKINLAEENSRNLYEQLESTELEVKALRKSLAELKEEKESVAVHYQQCLEKISQMESEILHAQEESQRLNREIGKRDEELRSTEERCDVLVKSNQSLQLEAENLLQKIALKDQELLEKHAEIERLQTLMHEEHSHSLQIESTLQTLQKLYSQSQQEQITLALELKDGLQLLKDLELSKQGFKEEMLQIGEERRTLHELNFSSTRSLKKHQMEISKLKAINEQLEKVFAVNTDESNALQLEIHQVKNDIEYLNNRYQAMLEQLQTLGLNPICFAASVKDLQNENSKLKEVCKMERNEKEAALEKSKDLDELLVENALMEFYLYTLNDESDGLRATVKKFQESCQILKDEKSILVTEKSTLLSQLETITESMNELLEKNTLLEKSLSDAKLELEGMKVKSGNLEDKYKLLIDEKSNLLNEKSILVSQLESVETRLGNLERSFTKLEEKYVEKEKPSTDNELQELRASILVQKEKHANHKHSNDARLANLENLVRVLQEERRSWKLEFEEELDKAVNAQVEMFILQHCVEDLERNYLALLIEYEKLVEASKFSDEVISELESENLMQLVEVEFLLDENRKLKMGIHQMCEALHIDPNAGQDKGIKQEEIPTCHILDNIEGLKRSLMKIQEEKQQLVVENSVLLTSLRQHQSEGEKLESEKKIMERELQNMREQNVMLQNDNFDLLKMNKQMRSEVFSGEEKENILKRGLATLHVDLIDLQRTSLVFQEENSKLLKEKNSLLKSVSDLKDAISSTEDENNVMLHDVLALSNLNLVYESFVTEKIKQQSALSEHLNNLNRLNSDLKQELGKLRKKFEVKEAENVYLNESIEIFDKEMEEAKNANAQLSHQIENSQNLLEKKEAELLEMEKRLAAAESLNAEFSKYIEELKMERDESRLIKDSQDRQILELSENCMNHRKLIDQLNEENRSFLSVMRLLHHELEQHRVREETLNSELRNRTYELDLWEAEATKFYFDLQISSTREALLESKVNELTGVCKRIADESAAKSLVIEQMTRRISLMESELGGLKEQLSAYIPVIRSLGEDFAYLELTSLLWTNKSLVEGNGKQKDSVIGTCLEANSCQSLRENKSMLAPDGVLDLLSMQARIRTVEKIMMEETERRINGEHSSANTEAGAITQRSEASNLEVDTYPEVDNRNIEMELKDESTHDLSTWKTKSENGLLMMKDIQLDHNSDDPDSKYCKKEHNGTYDQMLEICEAKNKSSGIDEDVITCCHQSDNSANSPNSSLKLEMEKELGVDRNELLRTIRETTQDGKRRILERLASDAQKLAILKMTVQDMKKKPETKKKSKMGNDIEYETVRRHMEEVEEAVMKLADINHQLTKDIEGSNNSSMELEKGGHIQRQVIEQARRGSEQIGRLQFEVHNIQYLLLKLADEKNNNNGKITLSRPRGVLLRNFVQLEKLNSRRRNKRLCGCSRPSTEED